MVGVGIEPTSPRLQRGAHPSELSDRVAYLRLPLRGTEGRATPALHI